MRALPLLAVFILAPLTDAIAQELPLQPGQRVRVTAPDFDIDKHEQTFQRLHGDTLVFTSMRCALSDVTQLDVYQGRQGHLWLGAGIGSAVGAVAGVVTGVMLCKSDWWCSGEEGLAGLAGAGIGGLAGALLGGGIGASIKTDRWEEVPLDRLHVSVVAQRDGFGIAASIAF